MNKIDEIYKSKLKISTMTILAKNDSCFELKNIYDSLLNLDKYNLPKNKPFFYLNKEYLNTLKKQIGIFKKIPSTKNNINLLVKSLYKTKGMIYSLRYLYDNPFGVKKTRFRENSINKNCFNKHICLDIVINDEGQLVNLMIFANGTIKIAGCKNINNAITGIKYFLDLINLFGIGKKENTLTLTVEMINLTKQFPYRIAQEKLNELFYKSSIFSYFRADTFNYVKAKINPLREERAIYIIKTKQKNNRNYMKIDMIYVKRKSNKFITCSIYENRITISGDNNVDLVNCYKLIIKGHLNECKF